MTPARQHLPAHPARAHDRGQFRLLCGHFWALAHISGLSR